MILNRARPPVAMTHKYRKLLYHLQLKSSFPVQNNCKKIRNESISSYNVSCFVLGGLFCFCWCFPFDDPCSASSAWTFFEREITFRILGSGIGSSSKTALGNGVYKNSNSKNILEQKCSAHCFHSDHCCKLVLRNKKIIVTSLDMSFRTRLFLR